MLNLSEDILRKIELYTLENAVTHNGKAVSKPVLNKILADHKELLENIKELNEIVERKVEEINKMKLEDQKIKLELLGWQKKNIEEKEKSLKDIAKPGERFVVRFAPNPDGALTIGNARPAILCDEYAKRYNGTFILRFDDTDPKIKVPEKRFYRWVIEDLKWLGIKIDKIVYQSKRLKIYYEYAEELIKMGKAYVCTCDVEEWRKLRNEGKPCKCRELSPEENLIRWKKMFNEYKEHEAVLRIKTSLVHENFAVRDFPAFRIVEDCKHPLVKARVWPLYNFASAIDDYLLNITHILRGQEHSTNATKQEFIYKYFGWEYPKVFILGRISLSDMVLSKSKIRAGINNKIFSDWNDPKLGTIRALRRRGFSPVALRKIILDIGIKPNDVVISKENLEAYNRKIVDELANRYFFVKEPIKIKIEGLPFKSKKISLHPTIDRGYRELNFDKYFLIEREDFERFRRNVVRLKDLCDVVLDKNCKLVNIEYTKEKDIPKIQWVPFEFKIRTKVIMPDKTLLGYGESNLKNLKEGEIIRLERFGFCRVEKVRKSVTLVFTHK
ncbi:MAG: glutamate--tRNA ligase [Candidatus Aenigmatarchaeota archaeon]|nr:glutamate--tRNA ligase [Candidatus Aenigmarchaeota archaeon]